MVIKVILIKEAHQNTVRFALFNLMQSVKVITIERASCSCKVTVEGSARRGNWGHQDRVIVLLDWRDLACNGGLIQCTSVVQNVLQTH